MTTQNNTLAEIEANADKIITLENLREFRLKTLQEEFDMKYPVGKLETWYEAEFEGYTGPSEYFYEKYGIVSTWRQLRDGTVLRAANNNNTGGSDEVTITKAQMPAHSHRARGLNPSGEVLPGEYLGVVEVGDTASGVYAGHYLTDYQGQTINMRPTDLPVGATCLIPGSTDPIGEDQSHSVMQSYQNCYTYYREA